MEKCFGIIFLEDPISVTWKNVCWISFAELSDWSVGILSFCKSMSLCSWNFLGYLHTSQISMTHTHNSPCVPFAENTMGPKLSTQTLWPLGSTYFQVPKEHIIIKKWPPKVDLRPPPKTLRPPPKILYANDTIIKNSGPEASLPDPLPDSLWNSLCGFAFCAFFVPYIFSITQDICYTGRSWQELFCVVRAPP